MTTIVTLIHNAHPRGHPNVSATKERDRPRPPPYGGPIKASRANIHQRWQPACDPYHTVVSTELLELVGYEIDHYHILAVVTTSHPVGVDKQPLCPREFLFDWVLALLPAAHNASRSKRLCARVCPQVDDRLPGLTISARLGRLRIEKTKIVQELMGSQKNG